MSANLTAWLLLAASILFEVFGMLSLKYANGFSNIAPTLGAISCFLMSIWLMSFSLKHIEMGITYAIWAASSTAILALIGFAFYQEAMTTFRLTGLVFVMVGVVLLNLGNA